MFQRRHLNSLHTAMLKIFDDLSGDSCTLTPTEVVVYVHKELGKLMHREYKGTYEFKSKLWDNGMAEKVEALGISYKRG